MNIIDYVKFFTLGTNSLKRIILLQRSSLKPTFLERVQSGLQTFEFPFVSLFSTLAADAKTAEAACSQSFIARNKNKTNDIQFPVQHMSKLRANNWTIVWNSNELEKRLETIAPFQFPLGLSDLHDSETKTRKRK